MSRTPAKVTQADVARCIRAARSAGAGLVEVRPDGTVLIHMTATTGPLSAVSGIEKDLADHEEAVL